MKYLKSFESKKEKLYRQITNIEWNEKYLDLESKYYLEFFTEKEIEIIKETIFGLFTENIEAEINIYPDGIMTEKLGYIKIDINQNNLYIYKGDDDYFYITRFSNKNYFYHFECDTLDGVIEYFNMFGGLN